MSRTPSSHSRIMTSVSPRLPTEATHAWRKAPSAGPICQHKGTTLTLASYEARASPASDLLSWLASFQNAVEMKTGLWILIYPLLYARIRLELYMPFLLFVPCHQRHSTRYGQIWGVGFDVFYTLIGLRGSKAEHVCYFVRVRVRDCIHVNKHGSGRILSKLQ